MPVKHGPALHELFRLSSLSIDAESQKIVADLLYQMMFARLNSAWQHIKLLPLNML